MHWARRNFRFLSAALAVAAASQLGHFITYSVRFGSAALSVQSTGVHAYYPSLAIVLLGAGGGAVLAGVAVIALARLLAGRAAGWRSTPRWPVWNLFATLFTVQLTVFAAQETLEALIGQGTIPSAIELMIWGSIGQLPAALAAAIVVSWISRRLELALATLRTSLADGEIVIEFETRALAIVSGPARVAALAESCPHSFVKRGPPTTLLLS